MRPAGIVKGFPHGKTTMHSTHVDGIGGPNASQDPQFRNIPKASFIGNVMFTVSVTSLKIEVTNISFLVSRS